MKKNMILILLLKLFLIGVVKYLKEQIGTNSMGLMHPIQKYVQQTRRNRA